MSDRVSWAMALHDFFGARGNDVATVSPNDLRNVWTMMRDLQARDLEGQSGSISSGLYEAACSPGANVVAVWYRASILGVLQMLPEKPLTTWSHEGELDDAVFQIAATFPMKKVPVGLVKNGLPFDLQELVKQIGART
jgi:hypothetical protein